MRDYRGNPMRCSGADIYVDGGPIVRVDQTPIEVATALAEGEGMIEFTYENVCVYVNSDAVISAIVASFAPIEDER